MKTPRNAVYIAVSLDGYIADLNGDIEWLDTFPNPDGEDMGYTAFMASIDALVMGRNTYEKVLSFDVPWPYKKPVFVLSNSLQRLPENAPDSVQLINGSLAEVEAAIHQQGYKNLYIDGGKTIQAFLQEDRIDQLILTSVPVVLGAGIPLWGTLPYPLIFECYETKRLLGKLSQASYRRVNGKP